MSSIYTIEYLKNLLITINDDLNELIRWSVYNGGVESENIDDLKTFYADLRERLETLIEKRERRDLV